MRKHNPDRRDKKSMKHKKKPLVSIIIPSYNQGTFIRDAIDSCLSQDYRPIEVIIVDGASTDETVNVLHDYDNVSEVKWISEPDSGVVEAVNKGLLMARGETGGIQSSDDGYLPGAISDAVQQFDSDPELGLVYGDCVYVDKDGEEIKRYQTGPFSVENFLCKNTIVLQPAAFFRLDIANEIGGWNNDYFVADTEMWLRMVFRTQARKVDAFWGIRRVHECQRNTLSGKIVESYSRMIAESQEISSASRRIKRAAKSGNFITLAVYNSGGGRVRRFYNYWMAFLIFPSVRRGLKLNGQLFPGFWFFSKWYSKILRGFSKIGRMVS